MFTLDFPSYIWILLAVALIAAVLTVLISMRPLWKVASYKSPFADDSEETSDSEDTGDIEPDSDPLADDNNEENAADEEAAGESVSDEKIVISGVPGLMSEEVRLEKEREIAEANAPKEIKASVIVYDKSPEKEIFDYLDILMNQDYPNYEVILVEDTTMEGADTLSKKYSSRYDNLYVTFLPPGSHNISRRKMAFTLGFKAAKGEVVITTISNAYPSGNHWLSEIMRPFNADPDYGISLGYAHLDFSEMRGLWRWYRQFDSVMGDAFWIYYAINDNPYRGDGNNLAFRRQLYFDNKGYSSTAFLQNGDDDLFIRQLSRSTHTAMVLDKRSFLTETWQSAAKRMWTDRKDCYNFTRRWLPKMPFFVSSAISWGQWIVLLSAVAAGFFGLPSLIPAITAASILILFWASETVAYRRCAGRLNAVRLWWSLPAFMLIRPIANAVFQLLHWENRVKNFTWQRWK